MPGPPRAPGAGGPALTLVRYPHSQVVVVAGAPGPAHVLGPGYRDDPTEAPTMSELEQFLNRHAMAW